MLSYTFHLPPQVHMIINSKGNLRNNDKTVPFVIMFISKKYFIVSKLFCNNDVKNINS